MANKVIKPRRYVTLRLKPEDRSLLQDLGRGREGIKGRYDALLTLNEIIKRQKFADIRDVERRPFRIGIPESTDKVISKKVESTGQNMTAILLSGARAYRARYPLKPHPKEKQVGALVEKLTRLLNDADPKVAKTALERVVALGEW